MVLSDRTNPLLMLRLPVVALLVCALMPARAQRNLEIGLSTGVTHYYGDLGNWHSQIQWNSTRPAVNITFRDFFNNPKRYVTRSLTMEARLSWFRIGYNEAQATGGLSGVELHNWHRALNFRTDLVGVSAHMVLNAYREPFTPLFKQRFFMYFQLGIGLYYGRPKADLFRGDVSLDNRYFFWDDGTIRDKPRGSAGAQVVEQDGKYETDLYSWVTEGTGTARNATLSPRPSPWNIGIPMGMGVRYMLTKQMSIGAEFSYYMFLTDMLDNVSERYATYDEIGSVYADSTQQFLARYISDPTGWGTDGTISKGTSRRGNPGLPDNFSYFSFEVSYKFKRTPGRRSFMSF
jgi:opacity protein-like surface antigen